MTSAEEDVDSHDFNIPTDHGHVARNCLMKSSESACSKRMIDNVMLVVAIYSTMILLEAINYFRTFPQFTLNVMTSMVVSETGRYTYRGGVGVIDLSK